MKALILRTGYDPDAGAPASRSPLARPQTVAPVPSCLRLVCPLSAPPRSSPGCASRGPAEGPPYELAKARVFELLGVRWAWDEGPNPPELPTITLCPFPAAPRRTRVEREIEHDYKVDLFNRCQREQLREAQMAFYYNGGRAAGGR